MELIKVGKVGTPGFPGQNVWTLGPQMEADKWEREKVRALERLQVCEQKPIEE